MNYRILLFTAMLAVTMQACQGTKKSAKKKDPTAAAATTEIPAPEATSAPEATVAAPGSETDADVTAQKAASDNTDATLLKGECVNPIAMTVQAGETEVTLDSLVTGEAGSYQLIATEYFSAIEAEEQTANNLHFLGSEIPNDNNLKEEKTSDDKIEILCATKAKGEGDDKAYLSQNGDVNVPNAFDTKDGAVHIFRRDEVKIKNGKAALNSVLTPKEGKITMSGEEKPEGLKFLVVKKDNSDITIKMQFNKMSGDNKRMTVIMSATYRLQK